MERFLKLTKGLSIAEVENIIDRKLSLTEIRQENFKCDTESFVEGVTLFFDEKDHLLYTIRFDSPFLLPVRGVSIGATKKEVKGIKGKADRIDPFPFPKTLPTTIWMYGKIGDWVRYDFEKTKNGKCVTIYLT